MKPVRGSCNVLTSVPSKNEHPTYAVYGPQHSQCSVYSFVLLVAPYAPPQSSCGWCRCGRRWIDATKRAMMEPNTAAACKCLEPRIPSDIRRRPTSPRGADSVKCMTHSGKDMAYVQATKDIAHTLPGDFRVGSLQYLHAERTIGFHTDPCGNRDQRTVTRLCVNWRTSG